MNSVPPQWSGRYMAIAVDSESVIKETFANVRFNPHSAPGKERHRNECYAVKCCEVFI